MHDAASTPPPRRKRSAKSMAVSDNEDPTGEGLRRVSIACTTCRKRKIRCDGRQPSCTTCTKNRKVGCTYVRVTPEENLEVKARKRLAREQKAQYKALGIDPPPKVNIGRRRWEHNIRFEQEKVPGVPTPQRQPARASEPVVAPSPQGFSTTTTTTWRLGDSIQGPTPQSAPVAIEERRGYFEHLEPAPRSGQPQASLPYTFPPVKPLCGPMPAYSPYPLTPPMDEYQPGPRLDDNNALGLFSPPEPYGNHHSSWLSPSPVIAAAALPVFATSRVPSLRLQRSVAFQPAPKPLHHLPAPPESLSFVPSRRQVVPYPSPQMSTQFLPLALPGSAPLLPPAAPLYAPDPARPAATCDFIPRVAATPPLSERERCSPAPPSPPEQEDRLSASASLLFSGGPSVSMPLSVLAQAEYPQTDFGHSAASAAATTSYEAPAVTAPTMFPSTSWSGLLYVPNARHPAASYPSESWRVEDTHAHSTPELYSSAGW